MKCIASIALLGFLVLSCQKKENSTTSNTNSEYDSATVTDPSVNTATPMSHDSIPLEDSASTMHSSGNKADSVKTAK